MTTKTLSTSYPSTYKYGDDAKSALERAQAILYNAEKAVPTTAEKIVWPLGGVGIHGGITGMRGNT